MANDDNEKENIAAITNEENRENDNVFTLENVQNYILAQLAENTVKKTEYDLNVWKRFFRNKGEEREIEDIPAEELNILICHLMTDISDLLINVSSTIPPSLQSASLFGMRLFSQLNSGLTLLYNIAKVKGAFILVSQPPIICPWVHAKKLS